MRKLLLLILFASFISSSQGQYTFLKAVKVFYKVNPFDRKYSAVLNNILSDTSFVKTQMVKRTDTNFFFLSGYYKRFNPFDFFYAQQTQLRVAEYEITHADAKKTNDTLIIYQISGISGPGEENKTRVQKELEKFNKKFRYDFSTMDIKETTNDGLTTAVVYNYYFAGRSIPAMSAAWGKMPGENNYVFTITLRLKIIENFADLPKAPDEL
jgi:hypothetical protein